MSLMSPDGAAGGVMKKRSASEIGRLETAMAINKQLDRILAELEQINAKCADEQTIGPKLDRITTLLEDCGRKLDEWLAGEEAS